MNTNRAISVLFYISAIYDGVLGIVFLFGSHAAFQWSGVTPPNHMGYVQFPAALLIVFAVMFTVIAVNPGKNRHLIPYGILLKISYCGVVLFHWIDSGIPYMWKPFCLADFVFLILFVWAWTLLGKESARTP